MAEVADEREHGGEPEAEDAAGVTTAEKQPVPDEAAEPESTADAAETASPEPSGEETETPSPEPTEAATDTAPIGRGSVFSGAVTAPKAKAQMRSVATPRRARVVIKKLGPWSVLKLSLLFYFCVMIVFLLALVILFLIMSALGTLDDGVKLLSEVGLVDAGFKIHGSWLLLRVFAGGVALVVLWSIVNVFAVFLYNLISDVIGGIEITLAERR